MNGPLAGRHALVTGASKGIGRACALALARAGAEVTAVARSADELDAVVRDIASAGGRAEALPLDVRDEEALLGALDARKLCDVLVNAVGTNAPAPFRDVTREQYDTLMGLNVRTAFVLLQRASTRLVDAGRSGSLITVSSQMGHVGAPLRTVYCATKHALEGLTKAAAVELAPYGIRVNTVAPTFVETAMTRPMLADPAFASDVLASIPAGRLATAEEVADAAVFLAGDAAAMITGHSLLVDGGWTAR